jgi:hypothetical protein
MTQEHKDLLLKDLCARLHTCNCINGTALIVALADEQPLESNQWLISNYDCYKDKFIVSNIVYASDVERLVDIDNIKPYLFPLSSISEDQKYDFYCRFIKNDCNFDDFKFYLYTGMWRRKLLTLTSIDDIETIIDWFHKNHIDWRGLIHMGLVIDATGLNIY